MEYNQQVFDAWLAAAELPYEWLIPLLHEVRSATEVFRALIERKEDMRDLIPESGIKKLFSLSGKEYMDEFAGLISKYQISSVTILDEQYPHCLRELPDPPGILFYQGEPACMKAPRKAAMIGSRSASYAGLKAARKISRDLSRNGVTIISGLAYGIDAECHRGCIEGGSPTVAIMGCGLDQAYPQENEKLKRDIMNEGGLIVSEYVPGARPIGHHFPYRNRIISGLADAVILMEAKIRSGSMTTVSHALKQGKDVYAYPGDPVSPMSEGNRLLLREGARYFTEAGDILADMHWLDNQPLVGQNIGCSAVPLPENAPEKAVYSALMKGTLGFDELLQLTGLEPSELLSTLTIMQIRKHIEPLPGKKYRLMPS